MAIRGGFPVPGCTAWRLLVGLVTASLVAYDFSWLPEMSTTTTATTSVLRLRAPQDELRVELEGASMENMTLIIGAIDINGGMLPLFLRSLREGEGTEFLVQHILFVAGDRASYEHCSLLRLRCHRLANSTQRDHLLGEVLKRGYSFVFTTMDVMWLRNPFAKLKHDGEDLQLSRDDSNSISSGVFFVSSNEKTVSLFTRNNTGDVDVLRFMRSRRALEQLGLKVKYLEKEEFAGFCNQDRKLDITRIATVHANCCPDTRAKVSDLTALLDNWRTAGDQRFAAAPSSCAQSWKSYQLESALRGASMENKTLVVSYLNKAYVEEKGMLDLFIRSLREGEGTAFLVEHLFLITVDWTAFRRCKKLKLHCYELAAGPLDSGKEQLFMSEGYINLVWQKILVLREILKRGYNFIFTDMDIIWLRNPFAELNLRAEDMQISCDDFNGDHSDESNNINTGFFFVVSNDRTVELFDVWLESHRTRPRMNDQEAIVSLKSEGVFRRLGLRVRYLDTRLFSGFCQVSRNAGEVTTMHANCCRGLKAKVEYLSASLEAWKKAQGGEAAEITWPEHICIKSWGASLQV